MYFDYSINEVVHLPDICCKGKIEIYANPTFSHILSYSFEGCNLDYNSMFIPDNIKVIGQGAFRRVTGILLVTVGKSVTSIAPFAFSEMPDLRAVTFPDVSPLASLGDYAFFGCEALETINLPSSLDVSKIGEAAFAGCPLLTDTFWDTITLK